MKLKTFEKTNISTITEYVVSRGDNVVGSFTVDYCKKNDDGTYDTKYIDNSILKRMVYENSGAKVRFVDVNSATGHLRVTLDI